MLAAIDGGKRRERNAVVKTEGYWVLALVMCLPACYVLHVVDALVEEWLVVGACTGNKGVAVEVLGHQKWSEEEEMKKWS